MGAGQLSEASLVAMTVWLEADFVHNRFFLVYRHFTLGPHLREGPAVAIEDRVAAGLGLPALHGDIGIGRADFHREHTAAVGLARHDL